MTYKIRKSQVSQSECAMGIKFQATSKWRTWFLWYMQTYSSYSTAMWNPVAEDQYANNSYWVDRITVDLGAYYDNVIKFIHRCPLRAIVLLFW